MSLNQDYARTVGDLLMRQGQIQADAAQRRADTWRNVVDTVASIPNQMQAHQRMADDQKLRALQVQQAQGAVQQQQTALQQPQKIAAVIQSATGPDGSVDYDKAAAGLAQVNPQMAQTYASLAKAHRETADAAKAQRAKNMATFADSLDGADTPDKLHAAFAFGASYMDKNDLSTLADAFDQGGDTARQQFVQTYSPLAKARQAEATRIREVPKGGAVGSQQGGYTVPNPEPAPKPETEWVIRGGRPTQIPKGTAQAGDRPYAASDARPERPDTQWVLRDGQPVEIQKGASRPGDTPYSNTAASGPAPAIEPGTPEFKVAQDLASGALTSQQFRSLTAYGRDTGKKMAIYAKAAELNPEFNAAQFDLGFKMASNPQIRQRIVAINSLSPVIDKISELADQVGNGDIPAFNRLINAAKFNVGNQRVTNFRQMQTLLGDEVGNALGVGTASDLKTKLGLDLVNPNLSAENFKATMEQLRSVLDARRDQLYKGMSVYGDALHQQDDAAKTPPPPSGKTTAPQVGQTVTYQGKSYQIVGLDANGHAQLKPVQ